MCSIKECKKVCKTIDKEDIYNVLNFLEKCEKCCYKKQIDKQKDSTYQKVRMKYVQLFSDNMSLIASFYRRQH